MEQNPSRQQAYDKLVELQVEWLDLWHKLTQDPSVETASVKLAGPFLSKEPEGCDLQNEGCILYIGKATAKDWFRLDFEANPTRVERLAKTEQFTSEVATGWHRSDFWQFAEQLGRISSPSQEKPFANLIWSNIAKIGVNAIKPPSVTILNHQKDLACRTLIAEINYYRPRLIMFVSHEYADSVVWQVLQHFGIDKDDVLNREDDIWWHHAADFPALVLADHPQGKTPETRKRWLDVAEQCWIGRAGHTF